MALASVVANTVIVVTGGAVRLTDSGLGCPTWPRCTDASLTPTAALAGHGIIEFTSRQLTFVLTLVAIVTMVAALRQKRQRGPAVLAFAVIPVQAVVGGISVLTHLNPWVVSLHFLTSMAALAITSVLYWRLRDRPPAAGPLPGVAVWLTRLLVTVAGTVLVLGTIVTGSGPHAGDTNASGRVHRTGLNVASMSQLHADLVMVLVGLTVGLGALLYALPAARAARRPVLTLLGVLLAQAAVGYTQYFLGVPPLLVLVHMLGACLTWLAVLRLLLVVSPSQQLADGVDHQTDQRTDHRAVDADELQIAANLQFEAPAGVGGVPARDRAGDELGQVGGVARQ